MATSLREKQLLIQNNWKANERTAVSFLGTVPAMHSLNIKKKNCGDPCSSSSWKDIILREPTANFPCNWMVVELLNNILISARQCKARNQDLAWN